VVFASGPARDRPLTARGLGTCVQVSIAGYPETVREQLNIPDELSQNVVFVDD
jgi:hypothetical protein